MALQYYGKLDRLPKGAVGLFSSYPTHCPTCREIVVPCRCVRNYERHIKHHAPHES